MTLGRSDHRAMVIAKQSAYMGTLDLPESDQECWCLSADSDASSDESLLGAIAGPLECWGGMLRNRWGAI